MNFNWKTFAVAAVVLAGCSSDHTSSNDPTRISNPAAAAQAGAAGAGSTTGSPPAGFGNSNAQPQQMPAVANDAGGVPVSDGSACVIGKFCAPTNADQGCGMLTLASTTKMTVIPGNILIIFDQSGSMSNQEMGMWMGTTKLAAARQSLIDALTPLQSLLTVGAIFLPDPAVSCFGGQSMTRTVQPIDGTGNIPFMAGPQFLQAFADHWSTYPMGAASGMGMGIGTPLNEAFDVANVALQAALPNLIGNVAVLVFTDGMPNCMPDATITMIPTKTEPTRAADWLGQNILTSVIGLPGADGVTYLNDIAVNGGTKMYLTPDDPAMLANQLKDIVSQQVMMGFDSCAIDLMPPTSSPDKLQLVVEETSMPGVQESVPHDLGWTINADGSHVELSGGLCDAAKSGQFAKLTFTFGCKDIPPLPPDHVH